MEHEHGDAIEKERAKKRQDELGRNQGEDPHGNISKRGKARDKAAEKIDADGGENASGGNFPTVADYATSEQKRAAVYSSVSF